MLLDILSGLDKIKICDYYLLNGQKVYAPCARLEDFANCIPHYIELDGWKEDITNVKKYEDLPINCQKYIETIEKLLNVPVVIVSVGHDKYQTIVRKNIF